ncbi:MAG: hypothetical protein BAJALOKI3v1_50017 [Promethearchaeota archaeon]|nr:MAG: hypothetical protein BAJALOKI3v1_50017 [Candidatus Lokiarchaeota archaeon]
MFIEYLKDNFWYSNESPIFFGDLISIFTILLLLIIGVIIIGVLYFLKIEDTKSSSLTDIGINLLIT